MSKKVYDKLLKIIIIGDSNVGKTSFLDKFVNNNFQKVYLSTIGVDFFTKIIEVDGIKFKIHLWDSCGQEKFKSLTRSYYRNMDGIIMMYDITDLKSFENIKSWLTESEKFADNCVAKILVGNKKDLEDMRSVSYEKAKKYAESIDVNFFEISNKEDYHDDIVTVLKSFVKEIYQTREYIDEDKRESEKIILEKNRSKCC